MDKPMTFIEWCSSNGKIPYSVGIEEAYEAGQQSQQAKVEELQKQFDQHDKLLLQRNKDVQELYDINAKHVAEKAELQKRVDAAIKCADLNFWNANTVEAMVKALKGEG
ncbi:hypothetical protein ACJOYH_05765 [Acinetobacter baumannii]